MSKKYRIWREADGTFSYDTKEGFFSDWITGDRGLETWVMARAAANPSKRAERYVIEEGEVG